MSKQKNATKEVEQTPEPTSQNPLMTAPGMIAAAIVVLIFIAIGFMLANRTSDTYAGSKSSRPPQILENSATGSIHDGEAETDSLNEEETLGEMESSDDTMAMNESDDDATDTMMNENESVEEMDNATEAEQDTESPANTSPKMYDAPPPMTIDPAKEYYATITTPRGDIVIKLRPDIAPQSVNSFVFLANEGFYDGLTWHRVIKDFMAQGGDPTGTGMGGPGYSVPAEFTDQLLFDRPGILAMARSNDPDSAGSQFFITTAPSPWLNNQYTPFGEVIQGQEIVNGIPLREPATATEPGETMLKITISEQNPIG